MAWLQELQKHKIRENKICMQSGKRRNSNLSNDVQFIESSLLISTGHDAII